MERKLLTSARLSLKAEGEEGASGPGLISGYGSVFGNEDSQGERVVPGAFKGTIDYFLQYGFIAKGHDWMSLPVATPETAEEDETGLDFTGMFHSTAPAQEARTVVKERLERKKVVGLSIGYEVLKDRKGKDGVRELEELQLFEISIVTIGANDQAMGTDAKSMAAAFGLPGLKLEDHSTAVRSAIEEYTRRLKEHRSWILGRKEGRVLSEANRKRMEEWGMTLRALAKEIDSLHAATAPKGFDPEFLRWKLRHEARNNQVGG